MNVDFSYLLYVHGSQVVELACSAELATDLLGINFPQLSQKLLHVGNQNAAFVCLEVVHHHLVQEKAQNVSGCLQVLVERVIEELQSEREHVLKALCVLACVLSGPDEERTNRYLGVRVETLAHVLGFELVRLQTAELREIELYVQV